MEEEHRIEFGGGATAIINILHDEESYRVWEDFDHAEIKTFENRYTFWRGVEEAGLNKQDVEKLAHGDTIDKDGKIFLGLERYRHSGDVYALCGQGNFPDRRWDVSPIVGWICPTPELHEGYIKDYFADVVDRELRIVMEQEITMFNDAIGGNCWGYTVKLMVDRQSHYEEFEEDSCWGFLGEPDYCLEQAKESAKYLHEAWLKQRDEENKNKCPHCGRAYC